MIFLINDIWLKLINDKNKKYSPYSNLLYGKKIMQYLTAKLSQLNGPTRLHWRHGHIKYFDLTLKAYSLGRYAIHFTFKVHLL